jgi:MFS family permease
MLLWGVVTAATSKVTTYGQLLALRTIIGALEGGFTPGVAFVFSCWYRTDELGKRVALYITSGVMGGAFGGLIAGGVIDHLEGARGIRGWRWLFIVEGVTTVAAAIIAVFLLPDYPATCRQLTAAQKTVAVKRLQRAGIMIHENEKSPNMAVLQSLLKSLQDWRTYAFSLAGVVSVHSSVLLLPKLPAPRLINDGSAWPRRLP